MEKLADTPDGGSGCPLSWNHSSMVVGGSPLLMGAEVYREQGGALRPSGFLEPSKSTFSSLCSSRSSPNSHPRAGAMAPSRAEWESAEGDTGLIASVGVSWWVGVPVRGGPSRTSFWEQGQEKGHEEWKWKGKEDRSGAEGRGRSWLQPFLSFSSATHTPYRQSKVLTSGAVGCLGPGGCCRLRWK